MQVIEAMVKSVRVCSPEDNLAKVAAIMWEGACGALPVVDAAGTVASIITDRDVCIAVGTRSARAADVRVKDVSLPRVFTCSAADDVQQALQTMVAQNVRRLPVVDARGKILGILSIDDLIRCSKESARGGAISYCEVVLATKAILAGRALGHEHPHAELIAV